MESNIMLVGGAGPETLQKISLFFVPLMPLFGAVFLSLCVFFRRESNEKLAGVLATIAAFCSFVLVLSCFNEILGGEPAVGFTAWDWIHAGNLKVGFSLRMDRLSGVMSLVVTGIGTLIHFYSIGYMGHDENRSKFFCYLNLFLFSMLLLVLGDNLLMTFVGWEGVGLCSYLLIGFWYKEMPNAVAGQKAFVVNRIGDAGFLLGLFILFVNLGAVDYTQLAATIDKMPTGLIELTAILLFVGAAGKSAQIPLYVWLPDAMAGPTPVSALIHAATMVTAGIYMICRMSFLYTHAPIAMAVIAVVGALTAFVAATIATSQFDIKKVLAYSTVSQLGYMFLALGMGAFSNAIFHVVTHAFFKACLFMGAGSVIAGCHHEQDMRKFGGLWKKMPVTFVTYLMATYAIAGLPFASGFYSKDQILWATYSGELSPVFGAIPLGKILWCLSVVTAFMTAFYMTRSLFMTFFTGPYRGHHEAHESPLTMTIPLILLAIPSILFGYLEGETLLHFLSSWSRPDLIGGHHALAHKPMYHELEMLSIFIASSGVTLGALHCTYPSIAKGFSSSFPTLHNALINKWWVDEIYFALIVKPLRALSGFLFKSGDRVLIDGSVNTLADVTKQLGISLTRSQSGLVSSYAHWLMGGVAAFIMIWFIF